MKLKLASSTILLALGLMIVPQTWALEIQVEDGAIYFYEDNVLGESTGAGVETTAPTRVQTHPAAANTQRPVKTVTGSENKRIYVKAEPNQTTVELRPDADAATGKAGSFAPTEKRNTDQVRVNFPAKTRGDGNINRNINVEEPRREMVELKNKVHRRQNRLELTSRNTRARLLRGAEFGLDPETNQVTVVTPSGEERVLNHLPDQALERMSAAGLFKGQMPTESEEATVEVKTNEQGELIYTKPDTMRKRVFGLFPRSFKSEVILNDATGEISEREVQPSSLFEQFLTTVAF